MKLLIDLLATVSIAYIAYNCGYFRGIYDYVQMVEKWAEKQEKENEEKTETQIRCAMDESEKKEIIDKGNYDIDDQIGEQAFERKSIAEIEKECGVKRNDRKTKNKKWIQEQQRKEAEELLDKLNEAKEEILRKRKEHEQTR